MGSWYLTRHGYCVLHSLFLRLLLLLGFILALFGLFTIGCGLFLIFLVLLLFLFQNGVTILIKIDILKDSLGELGHWESWALLKNTVKI